MSPKLITKSNPSSIAKGRIRAPANGHPTMAPRANHATPLAVLRPPLQFMKEAAPSMPVYIVKDDGRYAVAEWKLPGLKTMARMNKTPMRGWMVRLMTR